MVSIIMYVTRIVMLGLWVGAMAGFAFLFAPVAFAHVGATPAFAATIAACIKAIDTMGDVVVVIALLITGLGSLELLRMRLFIGTSLIAAAATSAYEVRGIIPKMEATPLLTPAYQSLHRESSGVYSGVLILALLALVLSSLSAYRSASTTSR